MKDESCIFCKIVRREIPKEFKYEDDLILAFDDIHPVAPVHLLIIPKVHISDFFEMKDSDTQIGIITAIHHLIDSTGLDQKGYRIEVNGGGAQDIFHLHFHLFGPRKPYKAQ